MKKRICAFFLGTIFFTTPALSVMAETGEEITTGAQEIAIENETDVDADIKEQIESEIPEEKEEITISSVDDFLKFAQDCRLDTWSLNKRVFLTSDISLRGVDFNSIPSFGGEFYGGGHTISDLSIDNDMSYSGLFVVVQKSGLISDLKVEGDIIPSGQQIMLGGIAANNYGRIIKCNFKGVITGNDYVGAITGTNQLSGVIENCSAEGYVHGVHFTGGICGLNMGNISDCTNEAMINTSNEDTTITIDAMGTLNKAISLVKNSKSVSEEAKADVTASDTGGIAGNSIGIITNCINIGDIGYEHVGYNVGGIAGRQSGYMYKCTNTGSILGRKDVGGIVGQAEPYITVDLSTDIAYQLSEAIGKLHDYVTATLRDTKNQSATITNRLSNIQQFTDGALTEVKFIADGTIDYANGISGAASEAFSRVDYVMEEASKDGGAMDHTVNAIGNAGDSAQNIKDAVSHLEIESYLDGDTLEQYNNAKSVLDNGTSQYYELLKRAKTPFYNYYIYNGGIEKAAVDAVDAIDFYLSDGTVADYTGWNTAYDNTHDDASHAAIFGFIENGEKFAESGVWKHASDDAEFPVLDTGDKLARNATDAALSSNAKLKAEQAANTYAKERWVNPTDSSRTGYDALNNIYFFDEDMESATSTLLTIAENYIPLAANDVRQDAVKAMNSLESAAGELKEAGNQTRSILGDVAGRDSIAFPQFSDEYKMHTTAFVDNMKGMNDNFGILSSELNNATGVLVDDLQQMSDQFNTIMLLFTDAVDGVLEKDYTGIYSDVSLEEAQECTDATVDECINYGNVEGDIDTAGIAGAMAIEYEYDKESDITGIKDTKLNTSFITKCVLRGNTNYNNVTSEKNYASGICGLQEMGTIYGCVNMGNISSNSGEFVGGICGRSLSYIVKSKSGGILDGGAYVGGIAGDGMHISDCMSLIKIQNATRWYGAVAGHVDDAGIVRDNFFISDELGGIDRISYSKKAEPIGHADERASAAFSDMTISFILEDEDLIDGKELIRKQKKKYGQSINESEYPKVNEKEGYYVDWDIDKIDDITTDEVITARYIKYRTTICDELTSDNDGFYQGELMVDGKFKENERLQIEKYANYTIEGLLKNANNIDLKTITNLNDYETLTVTVPDDGSASHQIRFRPERKLVEVFKNYEVYVIDNDDGSKQHLEKKGMMGDYSLYDVEGNNFTLNIQFVKAKREIYKYIILLVLIVIVGIVILVVNLIIIRRNRKKFPEMFNSINEKVTEMIDSKEQLFYDDSKEEKTEKEKAENEEKTSKESPEDTTEDDTKNRSENNE
ncbi:hypothetical protein [Butyrivibrio sp. YAB3001]|uniref:hypothetical protein n=1 Tax=Butyrivibrio sp. YAB3001 TaxID=1520812 RepID=UPI0008F64FCA|nr:hypothetical protein [Butyrivibrio sp. YAB3001]SFB69615.1 hypothetical protein SAMN02910398_00291 [Butyrivibrio sp. YAB3001]